MAVSQLSIVLILLGMSLVASLLIARASVVTANYSGGSITLIIADETGSLSSPGLGILYWVLRESPAPLRFVFRLMVRSFCGG